MLLISTFKGRKVFSEKSDASTNMSLAPVFHRRRKGWWRQGISIQFWLCTKEKSSVPCVQEGLNMNLVLGSRTKPGFTCSFSITCRACPSCVFIFLAFLIPKDVSSLPLSFFHLYWKQYLSKALSAYYFIPKLIFLWFLSSRAIGGTATATTCVLGLRGTPGQTLHCDYQSRLVEIWL